MIPKKGRKTKSPELEEARRRNRIKTRAKKNPRECSEKDWRDSKIKGEKQK